jgi:predicted transcriptional regulator YdeE
MPVSTKTVPNKTYLATRNRITLDQIQTVAQQSIDALYAEAGRLGAQINGNLEFIYYGCEGADGGPFDLYIGLPLESQAGEPDGSFLYYEPGDIACAFLEYRGPMSGIGNAWGQFMKDASAQGLEPHPENQIREIYVHWIDAESPDNLTELQASLAS